MTRFYRTLVKGVLEQTSSLCVGGSAAVAGGPDLQCARDGLNRLTIPGTGLAGAFVETAGRIFPQLFDAALDPEEVWNRLSGKARMHLKNATEDGEDEKLRQSVWHFYPTHLDEAANETEPRQGVGIRQATGATAAEAKALYDIETIPAGRRWPFFFEIDALRGGDDEAEAVAFLTLAEWVDGRCWLGASAARGLGWMKCEKVEVLRLPLTEPAIVRWPCNRTSRSAAFEELKKLAGVQCFDGQQLRQQAMALLGQRPQSLLLEQRFCYLTFDVQVEAGKHDQSDNEQYGLDTLSVGGHAALTNTTLGSPYLAWPLGKRSEADLLADRQLDLDDKARAEALYKPDAPVVTTKINQTIDALPEPFLPGGGVRGPLRHKASAWQQGQQQVKVPDPNTRDKGSPPTFENDEDRDAVSTLFGLTDKCGRVLVRDGYLSSDSFQLVCFQHHAEDEFAGGVYGSGKFDRTAVLKGTFKFQIVIEAACSTELKQYLDTLAPALRLAELGYVPLGGGKWRSHGWLKWCFTEVTVGRAGEAHEPVPKPDGTNTVVATLKAIPWVKLGGPS